MERIVPKIPGDLAVYYTYTPGQKGNFDQPEIQPVVEFRAIYFIDATGKEHALNENFEPDLFELYGDRWEKEILG